VDARAGEIELSNGERIFAETLVWAAGVRPASLESGLAADRSRSGRIRVDNYLRVGGREDVYAIGDVASLVEDGEELPMLAPPAMQQARHLAKNLVADAKGRPQKPFAYRDKGMMATIGRNAAVAETERLALTGFVGWLAWLFLHLFYIISVRSRILILFQWAWEYVRYDRPIRIITRAKTEEPE
jgi:NADH dehydrogenase